MTSTIPIAHDTKLAYHREVGILTARIDGQLVASAFTDRGCWYVSNYQRGYLHQFFVATEADADALLRTVAQTLAGGAA